MSQYADKYPSTADELLKNTYVDDVQSGSDCVEELISFKKEATRIMEEGGFHLHKWHSNTPELEEPQRIDDENLLSKASSTYANLVFEPIPKKQRYLEYLVTQFQLVS